MSFSALFLSLYIYTLSHTHIHTLTHTQRISLSLTHPHKQRIYQSCYVLKVLFSLNISKELYFLFIAGWRCLKFSENFTFYFHGNLGCTLSGKKNTKAEMAESITICTHYRLFRIEFLSHYRMRQKQFVLSSDITSLAR